MKIYRVIAKVKCGESMDLGFFFQYENAIIKLKELPSSEASNSFKIESILIQDSPKFFKELMNEFGYDFNGAAWG